MIPLKKIIFWLFIVTLKIGDTAPLRNQSFLDHPKMCRTYVKQQNEALSLSLVSSDNFSKCAVHLDATFLSDTFTADAK